LLAISCLNQIIGPIGSKVSFDLERKFFAENAKNGREGANWLQVVTARMRAQV
jgi:hypothetical protein